MPEIVEAHIGTIAINPYRRLHAYPYIESKIETLQKSIKDVGLWPSVIARPLQDKLWKYEQAFGHHRIEAARRLGITTVPLIVEDLTDKQMLQYMGRENLEDYNAVFLIQLESWEATLRSGLVSRSLDRNRQAIEIATLLGWLVDGKRDHPVMNATAEACDAAYTLIESGRHTRDVYRSLNVTAARDVAERALSRIHLMDRLAKGSRQSAAEIERTKEDVADAAKEVAEKIRSGEIKLRDVRREIDFRAGERMRERPSPLFSAYANIVVDSIRRSLQSDSNSDKLAQIERVLGQISLLEDWEALRRLDVELLNLAKRAEGWRHRLTPSQEKIIKFRLLENGRNKQ
jgi:ParB family chromosome partitioning protein